MAKTEISEQKSVNKSSFKRSGRDSLPKSPAFLRKVEYFRWKLFGTCSFAGNYSDLKNFADHIGTNKSMQTYMVQK